MKYNLLQVRWCYNAIIWFAFFGIATTSVHAQSAIACPVLGAGSTTAKHELGINVFGLLDLHYHGLYPSPKIPRIGLLNGINYKRRVGRNAYRVSMDLYRDAFDIEKGNSDRSGYYAVHGNGMRGEIRLGFERQFLTTRFAPFAAIDIVGGFEKLELIGEGRGGFISQPEPEPYSYNTLSNRFGAALSVGFAYRFSKRITCSLESSAMVVLFDQHTYDTLGERSRFYLDPLRSVSLNYRMFR